VWLGNDDYSTTRRMTGGSLPAMVWQRLMAYAHQNIELKPIPGIETPLLDRKDEKAVAAADGSAVREDQRPLVVSTHTTEFLRALSEDFRRAPAITRTTLPEKLSAL